MQELLFPVWEAHFHRIKKKTFYNEVFDLMASRYREGAPVDDADAASEGEPEVVVEAPPLEPEPAAKVAASEEAAPSHQQLLARTIHAEIHSAACGFMQLHAALPRRFGDSRSRASLSDLFSSWKETGKLADDISAYPCLEDMGYIMAECRFVLSHIDEKTWWPKWITAPRDPRLINQVQLYQV